MSARSLVRKLDPLVWLLLTCLAACGDGAVAATEAVVAVTSNLSAGAELTRIDVEVQREDGRGEAQTRSYHVVTSEPEGSAEISLPLTFSVLKGRDPGFRLVVTGYGPSADADEARIVQQKTRVRFYPGESRFVQVFLGRICLGNLCEDADDLTCYVFSAADTVVAAGSCGPVPEADTRALRDGERKQGAGAFTEIPEGVDTRSRDEAGLDVPDGGSDAGEEPDAEPLDADSAETAPGLDVPDAAIGDADAAPGEDAAPITPGCGNGHVEQALEESCDDGADNGAADHCDLECGFRCSGACPVRVDLARAAGGDGNSWSTALNDVQAAVDRAQAQNGGEVWVKAGRFAARDGLPANSALLVLKRGVHVYGGFLGTERRRSERPADGRSVLDGRALVAHVVVGASNSTLDGFTITGGSALYNGSGPVDTGAGYYAVGLSDVHLRNDTFRANQAVTAGGALYATGSALTVEDCRFEQNLAGRVSGSLVETGRGAAVAVVAKSSLTLLRSAFVGNESTGYGAALYALDSAVQAEACRFESQRVTQPAEGATVYVAQGGDVRIRDTAFRANTTLVGTLVAQNVDATLWLVNSSVFDHEGNGALVSTGGTGTTELIHCTFADNRLANSHLVKVGSGVNNVRNTIFHSVSFPQGSLGATLNENSVVLFETGKMGFQPRPFAAPLLDRDQDGLPEYYLLQVESNPCFNTGSAAAAQVGAVPYTKLTTSPSGCLDSAPVDLGRHYTSPQRDAAPPCK